MKLRSRIEKVEAARPKRFACFSVINDIAKGRAWWRDDLTWENLTRPEYEQLKKDLEAKGVKIIVVFDIDSKGCSNEFN